MKRLLLLSALAPLSLAATWGGYGAYLAATQPKVTISRVEGLLADGTHNLPFYELMSPLPSADVSQLLPKLEYKKGPPSRFIERITLLVRGEPGKSERIVYHGRRSRDDLAGLSLFPEALGEGPAREARYIETALLTSQGEESNLSGWRGFVLRPLLLREASHLLEGVTQVEIMEQAGIPAFFFEGTAPTGGLRSTALFARRNSFYRVDYLAEQNFQALNPEEYFRKTFLTENRADALEYLAKNLSEVKLQQQEVADFKNIAWPILLLAAKVSVDPVSLEAYFHFAGISALLYKDFAGSGDNTQTLDILRNNVLAASFYAHDVNPTASQTAEIERLSKLLTRNFE